MRLKIKNISRCQFKGLVDGRYNMIEMIESEKFYNFTFSDNQKHKIVEVKLRREGQWDDTEKRWHYYFSKHNQCVTADWFCDITNAEWALTQILEIL